MSRNTLSKKGPGKSGNPPPAGNNRGLVLVLAGVHAMAILVIAVVAILSTTGGGNAENFTPNDPGITRTRHPGPGLYRRSRGRRRHLFRWRGG